MAGTWAQFEEYAARYGHWTKVLGGHAVQLSDGRHGKIDVAYSDPEYGVLKLRIRLPDKTSVTFEVTRWGSMSAHVAFPATVDLVRAVADGEALVAREKRSQERQAQAQARRRSLDEGADPWHTVEEATEGDNARLSELARRIHDGDALRKPEWKWLGSRGHIPLLEECLSLLEQSTGYMPAGRACHFWRDAALPARALQVTRFLLDRSERTPSDRFAWTCRAAALADAFDDGRDLELLDDADRCAHAALECWADDPYAYNALGRIWFLKGEPAIADGFFSDAARVGGADNEGRIRREALWGLRKSLSAMDAFAREDRIEGLLRQSREHYAALLDLLPPRRQQELLAHLDSKDGSSGA